MTEIHEHYGLESDNPNAVAANRFPRPQPKPPFEAQLEALPPDVRSVAESLGLRDFESAERYVAQYLAANRRVKS